MTEERQKLIDSFGKWLDTSTGRNRINYQCAVIAEKYAKEMVIGELMRLSPAYIEGMVTHQGEDFSYAYLDARKIDERIEELKQS